VPANQLIQLWTNEKSREFIAAEYPWFLETFDGYKYPIQRADSIRYFVLAHYGGTYIDLDDVCIFPGIGSGQLVLTVLGLQPSP
jgi:mannosyltransferase OCH1-like enzyme